MYPVSAARSHSVVRPQTPFLPSTFGLDALDNVYALHGVARLLTSWTGNLVRLRRSSDSVEQDFGYDPYSGRLPAGEILAWLNSATAFVTTLYDQSGNSRTAVQSNTSLQPTIYFGGAFPVVRFDKARGDTLDLSSSLGVFQNRAAGSLINISKMNPTQSLTYDYMGCDRGTGTGARLFLRQTTTIDTMIARKTDAGGLDGPAGFTADLNWHVRIARADWGAATARYDRDVETSADPTFHTAGNTDNTASTEVAYNPGTQYGNFDMSMGAWIVDALTDGEFTSLLAGLAPLKPS